jgi:hypothetical protein
MSSTHKLNTYDTKIKNKLESIIQTKSNFYALITPKTLRQCKAADALASFLF